MTQRFLLDAHLGRLTRLLRMLGVDAAFHPELSDDDLLALAVGERRLLLSKDGGLLDKAGSARAARVNAKLPRDQLDEVLERYDMRSTLRPLTRCLDCNDPLAEVDLAAIEARVPPDARRPTDRFWTCKRCNKVFWPGSHYRRMRRFADEVGITT